MTHRKEPIEAPTRLQEAIQTAGELHRETRRATDEVASNRDLLAFSVAGTRFAVDVASVAEVIGSESITPMPRTPPHVLGVLAYRGEVIAVIQLQALPGQSFLELDDSSRRSKGVQGEQRLVILGAEGMTVGLRIDGASQIIQVPITSVQPKPEAFQKEAEESEIVSGYVDLDGEVLTILEASPLLRCAKLKQ